MNSPNVGMKVIAVPNVVERTEMLNRIYTNLTKEPLVDIIVRKKANKISVYHKVDVGIEILIHQYIVVTIPVTINTEILKAFNGVVDYRLDCVIETLYSTIEQLQSLQGYKVTKGVNGGTTLEQLARCLHFTNGEH